MSEPPVVCASLPSSESATTLLNGDLKAWPRLLRDFIGRTGIVGTGLYLAGDREFGAWLRHSVAGAAAIEASVLWYRALEMQPIVPGVPAPPAETCASLPSAEQADRLLGGDLSTLLVMGRDFLVRMGIVGAGLWLAGDRDPGDLLHHTVGGSLAIAMFGLWYRAMVLPPQSLVAQEWDPAGAIDAHALPAPAPRTRVERLEPTIVPIQTLYAGAPSPAHVLLRRSAA